MKIAIAKAFTNSFCFTMVFGKLPKTPATVNTVVNIKLPPLPFSLIISYEHTCLSCPFPFLSVMNTLACLVIFLYYQLLTRFLVLPLSLYTTNNNSWLILFFIFVNRQRYRCRQVGAGRPNVGYQHVQCWLPT